MSFSFLLLLLVAMVTGSVTAGRSDLDRLLRSNTTSSENEPHSRQERFIAYNYDERRITFPPGTIFILTPTLAIPFLRNLPAGYASDMTISAPFKLTFDDFGITDEHNPWGLIPGISITAGRGNPQGGRENPEGDGEEGEEGEEEAEENRRRRRRYRRSRQDYKPHPLGDRLVLFELIEDYLMNLGHDGKACLLRAICETNEHPLPYHGLFGEFLQMLFRVSVMPWAKDVLPEYLQAEKAGSERGACYEYYKGCSKSLFSTVSENKYRRPENLEHIKERMEAGSTLQKFGSSAIHEA